MKNTVSTSGARLVVVVGELELGLEVGDRPQAADEEPRADRVAEGDGQAVERLDVHDPGEVRLRGDRGADHGDPVVRVQERRLAGVREHRDDDPVEDAARRAARRRGGRS